tara:strand:- start:920 stop:1297 length:378 start_codon:yes stop_codon:yes gene_type:complete
MIKIINTNKTPKAIGTYSQGINFKNLIFTSGQICLSATTGELVNDTFEAEARQVIKNLKNLLEAGGSSLNKIIKINVYMTDLSYFPILNEIFKESFNEYYPARSTVEVNALPMGCNIEIEAIAHI